MFFSSAMPNGRFKRSARNAGSLRSWRLARPLNLNVSHSDMRLSLVCKNNLSPKQLAQLQMRIQNCIHLEGECGPVKAWHAYKQYLYAFVLLDSKTPIAIAEASGRPVSAPGWWIDPDYRGQGYGNELIELLALHMQKDGVTGIGSIPIQTPNGKYDEQSRRLVVRLRSYF